MRSLIFVSLVSAIMAAPEKTHRIVGGSDTTIEQYPYMCNMMSLMFGWSWSQTCGGALLTSRTVLSAAHCYVGYQPSEWRVRLGSTKIRGDTRDVRVPHIHNVDRLLLHPSYSTVTIKNDVAIIFMETPAEFSPKIGTARIAGPNYNLPDGTTVTAIGWGVQQYGGFFPWDLNHVETNLINHEICAKRYAHLKTQPGYENYPDITPGMLCTGILDVGGKDTCQGDSGGPIIHNGDVVVGVVSWSYRCADAYYPGVNTRVSHYADWIAANGSV